MSKFIQSMEVSRWRPQGWPEEAAARAASAKAGLEAKLRSPPKFKRVDRKAPWDHAANVDNSDKLFQWVGDDLAAMARAGDIGSLRLFMARQPLDAPALNRLEGFWLSEAFMAADPAILEPMFAEWVEPFILDRWDGKEHVSEHLTACLGAAMARGGADPGVRAACSRLLPKIAGSGYGGDEKMWKAFGAALYFVGMPGEAFAEFVRAGAEAILVDDPAFLPTFASRIQCGFEDAWSSAAGRDGAGPGSGWDASWVACSREYLGWAAGVDLAAASYSPQARALSICFPSLLRAELAPEVAELCRAHGIQGGLRVESGEIGSGSYGKLPFMSMGRDGFFEAIDWSGRWVGPVDLALLHGRLDAARALRAAGMDCSMEQFGEMCDRGLAISPSCRSLSKDPAEQDVGRARERAKAMGEALEFESSARRVPAAGAGRL